VIISVDSEPGLVGIGVKAPARQLLLHTLLLYEPRVHMVKVAPHRHGRVELLCVLAPPLLLHAPDDGLHTARNGLLLLLQCAIERSVHARAPLLQLLQGATKERRYGCVAVRRSNVAALRRSTVAAPRRRRSA
jgi:hypothetical protein